jgi:hypothetical protein
MSLRDEIARVIEQGVYFRIYKQELPFPTMKESCLMMTDSIIALLPKTGMEKVDRCACNVENPFTHERLISKVCASCHGTGELVRDLTLEEAIALPKMLLEGKAQVIIKWWPSYRSIRESYIELPDGSRLRVKK